MRHKQESDDRSVCEGQVKAAKAKEQAFEAQQQQIAGYLSPLMRTPSISNPIGATQLNTLCGERGAVKYAMTLSRGISVKMPENKWLKCDLVIGSYADNAALASLLTQTLSEQCGCNVQSLSLEPDKGIVAEDVTIPTPAPAGITIYGDYKMGNYIYSGFNGLLFRGNLHRKQRMPKLREDIKVTKTTIYIEIGKGPPWPGPY